MDAEREAARMKRLGAYGAWRQHRTLAARNRVWAIYLSHYTLGFVSIRYLEEVACELGIRHPIVCTNAKVPEGFDPLWTTTNTNDC